MKKYSINQNINFLILILKIKFLFKEILTPLNSASLIYQY
jgi:hypothetical protein